jgi:hypothetical protein
MLAGAAARDQDGEHGLAERPVTGGGKLPLQVGIDRDRVAERARVDPTWIGILLVLLLHRERHAVLDRGQLGHRCAQRPLDAGFRDLLRQQCGDRCRPRPPQQPLRARERIETVIGGNRGDPERREILTMGKRRRQPVAERGRLMAFRIAPPIDVLVDEALLRQGA